MSDSQAGPRLLAFSPREPFATTDQDTIEQLRSLLTAAEAGEIVGLAFVTLQPAGRAGMGWTEGCTADRLTVVGGVSCLEAMMHRTLMRV
jgi:hypothetical protein